jgi:hypothetical protein
VLGQEHEVLVEFRVVQSLASGLAGRASRNLDLKKKKKSFLNISCGIFR